MLVNLMRTLPLNMSVLMQILFIRGQADGKSDCANFKCAPNNSNLIQGPGLAIKMLHVTDENIVKVMSGKDLKKKSSKAGMH